MPSGCAKHVEDTGGFNLVKVNGEGEGHDHTDGVTIWQTWEGAQQPLFYKPIYAWQRHTGCFC